MPSSRNLQNAHGPARQRAPLARLQAKNPYPQLKLHGLAEVAGLATAKGRLSRCRAARACHARARGDINPVPDLNTATALVPGITNRYCGPSFETATEPVIGRASARPVGDLLRMRSNSLKHNNLMLRSERRERLEAWAATDSPISHSRY